MKKILWIFAGLAVLVCLLIYVATGSVDHTPYFETDYFNKTRIRLDKALPDTKNVNGQVQSGFARINITPNINVLRENYQQGAFTSIPMAGYGDRDGRPADGIHDSLFVKAVALKVDNHLIILVGSDLLIIPPEVADSVGILIEREQGIKREQLFFSATHTHSSIGGWAGGIIGAEFAGEENPKVRSWLIYKIKECILKATADIRPSRLGTGSFDTHEFVKNRLVGTLGRVNSEFTFLAIEQYDGDRAILGAFSAHATTIRHTNMKFSAGYPGYWQRKLEEDVTDMAVFFAGTVGSHGPVGNGKNFEKAKFIGESLADSVGKYIQTIGYRDEISFSYLTCKIDLPEYHLRLSENLNLSTALTELLLPPTEEVFLQAARIGDLVWVTTPCDFSGEYALELKNSLHRAGYKSIISSFNGAYVGYAIPRKYFYLDKYESRTMAWFGPNLGDYMMDIIFRITNAVISG
jgi:neutral ceramidase